MHNIILLLVIIFTMGCSNNRSLRRFYYKYLDPPPQISLQAKGVSNSEAQLATIAIPIDEKIQELSRFLSVQDKVSYEEWLRSLATRFPWIQGAGVISADGALLYAQPEGLFKPVSFEAMIDVKTTGLKLQQKAMFVPVGNGDAFIFLGQPVFTGEKLIEYRVVAVSLSTLAGFVKNPSRMYLIGNETILWKGDDTDPLSPIYTTNWKKVEYNSVSGLLKEKGKEARYTILYLGPVPFILGLDILLKPTKE